MCWRETQCSLPVPIYSEDLSLTNSIASWLPTSITRLALSNYTHVFVANCDPLLPLSYHLVSLLYRISTSPRRISSRTPLAIVEEPSYGVSTQAWATHSTDLSHPIVIFFDLGAADELSLTAGSLHQRGPPKE